MLESYLKIVLLAAGSIILEGLARNPDLFVSQVRMASNIQSQWIVLALFPVTVLAGLTVSIALMLKK